MTMCVVLGMKLTPQKHTNSCRYANATMIFSWIFLHTTKNLLKNKKVPLVLSDVEDYWFNAKLSQ